MSIDNKMTFEKRIFANNRHTFGDLTEDKIKLSRTSALAMAAASFAALLVLMQVTELSTSLIIAEAIFSIAIPFLVFTALIDEFFILCGRKSFEIYKKYNSEKLFFIFSLSGYTLFGIGYFLIVLHLSYLLFLVSLCISVLLFREYHRVYSTSSEELDKVN